MNLQHLKYAIEVERAGSISKAAQKLYMNQPNLSKAIKELELIVGVPLFKRSTKGISATTEEGRVFIEYAKSILSQFEDMKSHLSAPKKNELRVAIPRASAYSYMSAGASLTYFQEYPIHLCGSLLCLKMFCGATRLFKSGAWLRTQALRTC